MATTTSNRTYTLTGTDANGCQASDSVNVTVQPALTASANANQRLCTNSGLSVPLTATVGGGVAPFTYAWTASPTCTGCITSPTSASTNVKPNVTTTFTVTITDANGTQAQAQTTVTVKSSISVNAGTSRTFTTGQTLPIGETAQTNLSYSWSCNKASCGFSSTTASNPNVTPTQTTTYTVTATDGPTCSATASVTLTLDPCATNNGGCDDNATCSGTTGTAVCTCNTGYSGDGLTCVGGYSGISAGNTHSCGIRGDGALYCWGSNGNGEIGDGTTTSRSVGVRVGTANDWTDISAGGQFTCGIRSGQMWCWGRNSDGEVGDGTQTDRRTPTRIGTATNWASVSAGDDHVCALQSDGTLWCWGETSFGQMGIGSASSPKTTPYKVSSATNWTSVSSGHNYTCALKTDKTLWCTGENGNYQLGTGSNSSVNNWTKIGSATDWASVDSGDLHTCAIKTSGTLWCWGDNAYGQLGIGSTWSRSTPTQVGSVNTWTAVATAGDQGGEHTCATRSDKSLWCWGRNNNGQLGDGTTTQRTSPVRIGSSTSWLSVDTGIAHTCALKADLTATCWGASSTGQPAP
jgi:hypothetical protein